MILKQVASFINQATRNKLAPDQIALIIDAVQRLGMDENMKAFQVWTETLTIYRKLLVTSFSANPVAGDIGKTVVGTTSGSEGTLISYVNTDDDKYLVVSGDEAFTDDEAFTITTGTGAGTLDEEEGYKGPYDFPTDPPVRKMHGITTVTDVAIFGSEPVFIADEDDYGLALTNFQNSKFFKGGRADDLAETWTFSSAPDPDGTDPYRWVYWREAPTITGLNAGQDANFLVPARYHFNFVNACIKCANMVIAGEPFKRADIEEDLGPWWESLRKKFTPQAKARNLTSMGNQPVTGSWI